MTNHAMLNNVDHKDLRVDTRHGAELGDNVMSALALPSEFRNIVADYPIFFQRDNETGKYLPLAMFGFQHGENLYLDGDQWNATYIPLMMQRGPFMIGFQEVGGNGSASKKMVISIDMDDPRVGAADGEPLFQPFGDNSEYTDGIVEVLQEIEHGQAVIEGLIDALVEQDLLEPFSLDVELNNGEKHRLHGFHTIHEEKLAALDPALLADFNRRGILQACYMVIASMANIPRLIALKNKRL
ncbi:MAG: SapC family protein [Halieaceae bacterium]